MKSDNKKKKILVSGLGPVGGFLVTYLWAKYKDLFDITVYDPRLGDYCRKQILVIDPKNINLMRDEFPSDVFNKLTEHGCWLHNPKGKGADAVCYIHPIEDGYFSSIIKNIEQAFYDHIKLIPAIKLFKEPVPIDMHILSDFDYLISASGGRDHLNELIGDVFIKQYLSNALVFTFNPKEHEVLNDEDPNYQAQIENLPTQYRVRGFRSRDDNYYIGIQLGNHEIEELRQFTDFHGPITYDNMPKSLEIMVRDALKKYHMEMDDPASLQVDFFPIIKQTSTVPAGYLEKDKKKSIVFMVGDSLTTTHFFSGKGVNNGFCTARELADLLADYCKCQAKHLSRKHNPQDGKKRKKIIIKRKSLVSIYKKMAEAHIEAAKKASEEATVDMDQAQNLEDEHTHDELHSLAKKHKLLTSDNMSRREMCLSISRISSRKTTVSKSAAPISP